MSIPILGLCIYESLVQGTYLWGIVTGIVALVAFRDVMTYFTIMVNQKAIMDMMGPKDERSLEMTDKDFDNLLDEIDKRNKDKDHPGE